LYLHILYYTFVLFFDKNIPEIQIEINHLHCYWSLVIQLSRITILLWHNRKDSKTCNTKSYFSWLAWDSRISSIRLSPMAKVHRMYWWKYSGHSPVGESLQSYRRMSTVFSSAEGKFQWSSSVSVDKDFFHVQATLTVDSLVDFRRLTRVHDATEKKYSGHPPIGKSQVSH